ncbi:MAG: hypothetical protein JWO97_4625 [Acidobacteria bacterium]|nr:hypothetical protein [Acidobacteriota bacterium]
MKRIAAVLLLLTAAGCASSSKPQINMNEPRRIVGTENDVRVDAEIIGDRITPGSPIPISYVVTNQRSTPILIADLLPETNFDAETGMVTIEIGTEIPGEQFLPRLISIASGEKRSFASKATLNVMSARNRAPNSIGPQALRIRINFLGETKPFEKLINIPEKAIHDPQLASDIFTKWVEGNETVVTNAIPMRYGQSASDEPISTPTPSRRRRGSSGPP